MSIENTDWSRVDSLDALFNSPESRINNLHQDFQKSTCSEGTPEFYELVVSLFTSYDTEECKFEDSDFDPLTKLPEKDTWSLRRVSEHSINEGENDMEYALFLNRRNLTIENIHQGRMGDCYILQCFISIASRNSEAILGLFPYPELLAKGVVVIKLWNEENNCYRLFFLDDHLPVKHNEETNEFNWYASSPAGPDKNVFWCALLEKCLAKIVGNFPDLDAGSRKLDIYKLHSMVLGPNIVTTVYDTADTSNVVDLMIDHFDKGDIISLSSAHSNSFINEETGLVHYHGYSLLDIRENVAGSDLTLLKCLNVWGKGGEWLGDWGDSSEKWQEHPEIMSELDFELKDEGMFWIDRHDFHRAFKVVWIAVYDTFPIITNDQYDVDNQDVADDEFSFQIINDACMDFKLLWVDFESNECEYANILEGCDGPEQPSYVGHVWRLRSNQCKLLTFTLGEGLFEENGAVVLVSDLLSS